MRLNILFKQEGRHKHITLDLHVEAFDHELHISSNAESVV